MVAKKVIKEGFMTEIDRFLRDYEKNRTQFPHSRLKEVAKYKKIYAKRDGAVEEPVQAIWKEF